MQTQKSFQSNTPTLYLVPTPIGNLSEFTPRAIEVLNSVDVIACEDTRTSGVLLKHYQIHKRLIAYQKFNESQSTKGILQLLSQGQNVALISDAGYPLINDPGQTLVLAVVEQGYNVVPISGPNAALNALVASGLIAQPYIFVGFLSSQQKERRAQLETYRAYPMTMIFYEAPHRITKTLADMIDIFGDRRCCVARELTKLHEEFLRGKLSEVQVELADRKGEMVIVVEGALQEAKVLDPTELIAQVEQLVQGGMKRNAAIKEIAAKEGIARNELYELVHGKGEA